MSDADNLLAGIARELTILTDPILHAADDPIGVYELLSRMGWDLDPLIDADLSAVETAARAIISALETLATKPIQTLDDAVALLDDVSAVISNLDEVRKAITTLTALNVAPAVALALLEDLLTYLLLRYVEQRAYTFLQLAILLTLVDAEQAEPLNAQGGTTPPLIRLPRKRGVIRLDRLPALLSDPVRHLRQFYIPAAGIATQADAELVTNTLFRRIRNVALALGAVTQVALDGETQAEQTAPETADMRRSVTVGFGGRETVDTSTGAMVTRGLVGVTATIVPADTQGATGVQGPGLAVAPFGIASVAVPIGTWAIDITAGGSPGSVFITSSSVALTGTGAGLDARVTLGRNPAAAGPIVIGGTAGTRLELEKVALAVDVHLTAAQQDFGVLGEIGKGALVIAAGDGDGFLQRVLPPEGVRVDFDFALGWSRSHGLHFRGSASLDATFPIAKDIAGVLRIDALHLAIKPDASSVSIATGATVSVHLGPITAAVERFGLRGVLTFPERGGNLGAADLSLQFNPPTGAALAIDAGVVVGGGYLLFDPQREQYSGAVHLEIAKKLAVTAFGLLTTRMPDGSKGFSLLVLISVRFTPGVPLAYGFTLNGIGGLLGVNRTVDVDALRAGLRAGTMGRILFPDDPIRNAPQIVSDLQTVFPPAPGRFIFGPVMQIGWGTPTTIVTLDLGLILELPAPVRLFILGRLRVLLPQEQAAIVRLQLDALGVIDFESGDVALDAVLYDSRVAAFAVTGDMALRANFGARPDFALAVGGFHPRYKPPQGFPVLQRVAISLAAGDNPRLRLDAYLALTTNTVQLGAHLELYAAAAGFSLQGYLGFDTLIQFAPFGFVVDIRAAVALKCGTVSVMSVQLDLTLSGPAPWRAQGRASFTILFLSGSIRFDVRFGNEAPPPLPPPVKVRELLLRALAETGNWRTQLPPAEHPLVALREDPGTQLLYVHPLADLQVRQRVVPLGREITRFGTSDVDGERFFTIGVVGSDNEVLSNADAGVDAVEDLFAPAQFTAMTDDQKLVAPAFESMQAGIRFGLRTYVSGAEVVESEMTYERKTMYAPSATVARALFMAGGMAPRAARAVAADPRGRPPAVLRRGVMERVVSLGSAASSQLTRSGAEKYRAPASPIAVKPPRFVAVTGRRGVPLEPSQPGGVGAPGPSRRPTSYAEALETARHAAPGTRRRGRVKIVPSYVDEVVR